MLLKRVIVCLDVRDGRTTKGVRFRGNRDVGDPVEMARQYYEEGADELVFYDITASAERRSIMLDVVERVAERIFIPFAVGGGLGSVEDMRRVLLAGAEKVSVNSQAVRHPGIIEEGAGRYGRQCIVLAMDAARDDAMPSGYRVFIDGMRTPTDLDALEWGRRAEALGAGEIVLNAIDTDGTQDGYELRATRLLSDNVGIPVVASGGAGRSMSRYRGRHPGGGMTSGFIQAKSRRRKSPREMDFQSRQSRGRSLIWRDRVFQKNMYDKLSKKPLIVVLPVQGLCKKLPRGMAAELAD